MSGLDRTLGAVFGLLRAAVLIGLAVIVLEFAEVDREAWWQEARLRPYAERVADAVKYYAELGTGYLEELPEASSERVRAARVVASNL
jgi:membrane protein required for colicin V production